MMSDNLSSVFKVFRHVFATQISVRNLENSNYLIVIKSIQLVSVSASTMGHESGCFGAKISGRHRSVERLERSEAMERLETVDS